MYNLTEHIADKKLKVEADIASLSKKMIRPTDTVKDVTSKDRVMWAALGGLTGLAGSAGIAKVISKMTNRSMKSLLPYMIGKAAIGGTIGYFSPDARNKMIQESKGEISSKDLKKSLKAYGKFDTKMESIFDGSMDKEAGVSGIALNLLRKGFTGGRKAVGGGVRLAVKHPLATTAGVVGAGAYGTHKLNQRYKYRSKPNYTTFLRNQVLAGNIQPNELTNQNFRSIRRLGMN